MKPHFLYLRYVLRHKWFVLLACWRRGLYWQGIVHDWSKFLPSEWWPYVEFFYTNRKSVEWFDAVDAFGVAELAPYGFFVKDRFNVAWNHHQKRNPHHWQYWLLRNDDGDGFPLPMPDRYRREMLADWEGAGRAIAGRRDWRPWWQQNKHLIDLHPETLRWVESEAADQSGEVNPR